MPYIDDPSSPSRQSSEAVLKQKLHELKKHFPNLEPRFDSFYLLRFLRARKGDVPKAVKMLQAHFNWRRSHDIDALFYDSMDKEPLTFAEEEDIARIYPTGYWGVDELGQPIYYERMGMTDFKALMRICTKERFIEYWTYQYEKLVWLRLPAIRPRNAGLTYRDRTVSFVDLRGFSWGHLSETSRSVFREITSLAANNYPEIMNSVFVLNAPKMFSIMWSGLKVFVDSDTRKKIRFISSHPGKKSDVDEYINTDALPDFLGGRVKNVSGVVDYGPWNTLHPHPPLPDSFLLHDSHSNETFVTCLEEDMPKTIEPTCYSCCEWWYRKPAHAETRPLLQRIFG